MDNTIRERNYGNINSFASAPTDFTNPRVKHFEAVLEELRANKGAHSDGSAGEVAGDAGIDANPTGVGTPYVSGWPSSVDFTGFGHPIEGHLTLTSNPDAAFPDRPPFRTAAKTTEAATQKGNRNQYDPTKDDVDCRSRLDVTVQRDTKVIDEDGDWYATLGHMTAERVRTGPPRLSPSTETVMDADVIEKGGPGQDRKRDGTMIKAGDYGLSTRQGHIHDTDNYNKNDPTGRKSRAMALWGHGPGDIGQRDGIDLHRGKGFTSSQGCLILGPKGGTGLTTEGKNAVNEKDPAPNYDGKQSAGTMDEFVEQIEKFRGVPPGGLPRQEHRIECVHVKIIEPRDGKWKTMTIR
ncbi:MAG: hypothetical protein FWD68_21850 [Alphaproteobacteria bacterium]|nr:hypothetical protein [Alphaproteobacteria bacterium]